MTGMNTSTGANMNNNTSTSGMTGMNTSMGANVDSIMLDSTNMGKIISGNANMPDNTMGMNMKTAMPDNCKKDIDSKEEEKRKKKKDEDRWIRYVAQAGDTLQDILDRSEGSKDMFWNKNSADRMYMLPGVAYFILENDTE